MELPASDGAVVPATHASGVAGGDGAGAGAPAGPPSGPAPWEDILRAAVAYAHAGLPVVPCHWPDPSAPGKCSCGRRDCGSAGKHPRTSRGLKDATTEVDIVRQWFGERGPHRGANIAIVAPEWAFILDVDTSASHAGVDGFAALNNLESDNEDLPETPEADTGGGGRHVFFRLPDGVRHGNERGALPAGLDVRGGGRGYIIAAPSLHSSGRRYVWRQFLSPDHVGFAEVPAWLLAIAKARSRDPNDHGGQVFDPDKLPTEIPPRLRRVIEAMALTVDARRDAHGRIGALVLDVCPACGDNRKKCYLTAFGRLKTHRENDCPAGAASTFGKGIALFDWVGRYGGDAGADALRVAADGAAVGGGSVAAGAIGYEKAVRADAGRVARALDELADAAGHAQAQALAMWAGAGAKSQRLPDDLRESLMYDPDIVWVDDAVVASGVSRLAAGIARSRRCDGPILRLRDGFGAVVSAVWVGDGARLPAKWTGTAPDWAGGIGAFGSIIEAAAHHINVVITCCARDYIAVRAMVEAGAGRTPDELRTNSGRTPDELRTNSGRTPDVALDAFVIGVASDADLAALAKLLTARWTASGAAPARCLIVRRAQDSAALANKAARVLSARAGAGVVELTTPGDFGGLWESLAAFGTASVTRQLTTAPLQCPAPSDIRRVGPHIREDLERCVNLATNFLSVEGRLRLVIYQVDPGAGKSRIATEVAAAVADGSLKVPIRERRPRGWPDALHWPPKDRKVAFTLASNQLAAEKHRDMGELVPGAARSLLTGALSHCLFVGNVAELYPTVGRVGICGKPGTDQRCPEADLGCPGALDPRADRGVVTFTSHAMAPHLTMDLCFIDEAPGVVDDSECAPGLLASLYSAAMNPRAKKWRHELNSEAGDAAQRLVTAASAIAQAHAADVSARRRDHWRRWLDADEMAAILNGDAGLVGLMRAGFGKGAVEPPVPYPDEVRRGVHAGRHMPSLPAFRMMRRLLEWYDRHTRKSTELPILSVLPSPPDPIAAIRIAPDGTWALSIHSVTPLPDCPAVVLDATGEHTLAEYQAAYPDRDIRVVKRRVVGTVPLHAVHMRTSDLRRGVLLDDAGRIRTAGAARIRAAILRTAALMSAVPRDPEAPALTMGIITYRPVHMALTGAGNPGNAPDVMLAELRAHLTSMGIRITAGYFGRHDRATNEFEDVDALVVIGDPTPNIGAVGVHCRLLGQDVTQTAQNRAVATLVQSVFRARHTRRAVANKATLVYAGARAPDVPGIAWDEEAISIPNPSAQDAKKRAAAIVRHVAESSGGAISVAAIRAFDFIGTQFALPHDSSHAVGITDYTLRVAVVEFARLTGLVQVARQGFAPKK